MTGFLGVALVRSQGNPNLVLRCELLDELAAAIREYGLVERVKGLLSLSTGVDQPGSSEDAEMVGDGGLGDIELIDDIGDVEPPAAEEIHDLLTGGIGQRFGKTDGSPHMINSHR